MLTQDERDGLARWAELHIVDENGRKMWFTASGYVCEYDQWEPDSFWQHSGLLFDTLTRRGHDPRLYSGYGDSYFEDGHRPRCCAIEDDGRTFYGREDEWPAAIAKAVLAMLEASDE